MTPPFALAVSVALLATPALAQVPPSPAEITAYSGLHAAAARGDTGAIDKLLRDGAPLEARDSMGRTALHVTAHQHRADAVARLVQRGADANALDGQKYDIVTIAAVADDEAMLATALKAGCKATNITSPYDGTALIAAAHLGHDGVVRMLIAADAPLDHINNLGWTAVIESIVLGNGGKRHTATLEALVKAGANVNQVDRSGTTPLAMARSRHYAAMVAILEKAGAR